MITSTGLPDVLDVDHQQSARRSVMRQSRYDDWPGDCAPKFDPVNGSIDATLAGVEAFRFEKGEWRLLAYARVASSMIVVPHLAVDHLPKKVRVDAIGLGSDQRSVNRPNRELRVEEGVHLVLTHPGRPLDALPRKPDLSFQKGQILIIYPSRKDRLEHHG